MHLTNSYVAYCFDEACLTFGSAVEEAMGAVKAKNERLRRGKAENVLRKFIGIQPKYRDISELMDPGARDDEDKPEAPFKRRK